MRVVECDVCGETISAADDEELVGRVKDHLLEEHDQSPDADEIQQTIDREAYDATDSSGRPRGASPCALNRPVRAAATAKPSTVTSPATLPPLRVASGIIESISITSSAPAAKPLMPPWKVARRRCRRARSRRRSRACRSTATAIHSRDYHARRGRGAQSACGADRLGQVGDEDRRQQAHADALARRRGRSRARAAPGCRPGTRRARAPARRQASGAPSGGRRSSQVRSRSARRARARARPRPRRRLDALLREVEADRADQRAGAEGEHEADATSGHGRASPSSAPMTSDDAASAPQPSAATHTSARACSMRLATISAHSVPCSRTLAALASWS